MEKLGPLPVQNDRFWLCQTASRGIQITTYQPPSDAYIGGPFSTRAEAGQYLNERRRYRQTQWLACVVALFVLATITVAVLNE